MVLRRISMRSSRPDLGLLVLAAHRTRIRWRGTSEVDPAGQFIGR
jgi:hypothetical protein